MPVSVFSPLARGFGTWTGELHLAENDKGPGPSLPSLLPEDPYCQHSGVTVKPRAKSAVSAFSARSAATSRPQTAWNEKPDGELVLPKTYLTKKGAIVLYAAPDDTQNIELSERDRLYLKKARKKLLKHRYVEYSNKIGSINRLTQSVLAFGDEDYNKETDSVSDSDKVWLKFTRDENDKEVVDKHSRPGGNIDMYLNDLMSRSGPRPSPPIIDWRSSVDLGPRPESVADSVDSSQGDLLSADSEYLMKYTSPQPPSLTPTRGGMDMGRASPSARPKKLSADKLAASLKSSGFLGRQTIIEEFDRLSESSSRPMTPANSLSRPQSRTRPPSTASHRKLSLLDDRLTESSRELSDGLSAASTPKSHKTSVKSGSSSPLRSEEMKEEATVSQPGSEDRDGRHSQVSYTLTKDSSEQLQYTGSDDETLQEDMDAAADAEIQALERRLSPGGQGDVLEDELRSRSKSGSRSRSRTSGSVNSRRKSRGSSGIGARTNTPEVSEVAGSGVEEHLYLSEDAEEESDWEDGETFTQPLMPSYNAVLDISLLSGGSGKGTFSFEATTVDNSPEAQDYVNDPVTRALSKQGSVRSERLASTSSNVSHVTGSRPQSTADRTSPSRPQSTADRTSLSRPQSSASRLTEEQHPESSAHSDISAEQERMNSAKRSKEGSLERELSERSAAETAQDVKDQSLSKQLSQAVDDTAAAAERPESAASSHSGVPSEAAEVAVLDDIQPEDTEEENESRREVEQSLADITTPKPPSSYASSVSSQELPPEPAVTEVRITPLSSAVSGQRTTPSPLQQQQKDTAVSQQPQTSHTTVTPQQKAESTVAADKPPSKPPAAVEKSKPATTAAKPVPSTTSAASKTAEEKTKTSTPPATHMTQAKKTPPKEQPKQTLKEQPKQPSKEQPKHPDQSKATAKSTKEDTKKAVIEDKKIKEEKKVKVEPIKKPEKQKAEKKEKSTDWTLR